MSHRTRLLLLLAAPVFAAALATAARAEDDASFDLVNRGRSEINEVYVSPSRVQNWGRDRLGQNTLPAGRRLHVDLPPGDCLYDIRVVWENGKAEERRRVDLCPLDQVSFP